MITVEGDIVDPTLTTQVPGGLDHLHKQSAETIKGPTQIASLFNRSISKTARIFGFRNGLLCKYGTEIMVILLL